MTTTPRKRKPLEIDGNLPPLKRGELKQRLVLDFTELFGFTTPSMMQSIIDTDERDYARRLERAGLINRIPVGTIIAGGKLCLLTPAGRLRATANRGEELPAFSLKHVPIGRLAHALAVQRSLLPNFLNGWTVRPERLLDFTPGQKRPDALLVTPSGLRVAAEIELTEKGGEALEKSLSLLVEGARRGRWDHVCFWSPSASIIEKYKARLNNPLRRWHYLPGSNQWAPGEIWNEDFIPEYFSFELVDLPVDVCRG
jgi:hypothetical protein